MKPKIAELIALAVALLIGADIVLSLLADNKIRNHDYFINKRIESAILGPKYDENYDCETDAMFYFYKYKTCFTRRTQRDIEKWSYAFHYARPFPVFLSFMDSFRFEMIDTGAAKFVIHWDGTIETLI